MAQWHSKEPFWFREMLIENSIEAKAYPFRVDLIHCVGDALVPYKIASAYAKRLYESGTKRVSLYVPDRFGAPKSHEECFLPSIIKAAEIVGGFERFR